MSKRDVKIERKGGYSGGSSKKPVSVPTSKGASVNKPATAPSGARKTA